MSRCASRSGGAASTALRRSAARSGRRPRAPTGASASLRRVARGAVAEREGWGCPHRPVLGPSGLRASCLPQIPCSPFGLRAEWGRPSLRLLVGLITLESDAHHARLQRRHRAELRERAHAARRASRGRRFTAGARHAACAWVAALGPMPTLEAQMRVRSPLNSKTQARLEQQARQHRSCLTESEARLWSALKGRQLGVQFRPEVLLGGRFIVDFFASSIGLVVEVDGGSCSSA